MRDCRCRRCAQPSASCALGIAPCCCKLWHGNPVHTGQTSACCEPFCRALASNICDASISSTACILSRAAYAARALMTLKGSMLFRDAAP
eukprot:365707-Chlamydomonas_euryale.AAC.16